ncbi:MAG TPA: (2Fe-2S) ferredoxin domain-containing protein [Kofleriaceae bacterium]|nr:(2Fe-2S) ferredoxin domain-containing protein [Kofleriaceae bacterium]
MLRFERHIFVCTQARAGGGKPSCGARGSQAIVSALERAIASRPELATKIGITSCACLGPCFDGPNAVVYPDGVWYANLDENDVDDLIAHLAGGAVVERRRYSWPDDE